jgi:hypothetical protein
MTAPIEYVKLPDANVVALFTEGNYLLAKILPPNLMVDCYIHSRGDVIKVPVKQVYDLIQESAVAWCEI